MLYRLLCLLACADDEILPSFKYVNKCVVKIDSIFIKHLRYAEWTLVNLEFSLPPVTAIL
jgi:hypothetical protein